VVSASSHGFSENKLRWGIQRINSFRWMGFYHQNRTRGKSGGRSWNICCSLLMPLHAEATASDVSCNPGSRKNGVSHGKMLALETDATILFFRTRNGSARLCIKLAENAIDRLQYHTSLSAYNTLHRHRRQEHLTQPLAKKGQKAGTKLLDRVTTNAAHTSMAGAEDARTNVPLLMRLERRREASKWQGLDELGSNRL
jgi:hypothetical protein